MPYYLGLSFLSTNQDRHVNGGHHGEMERRGLGAGAGASTRAEARRMLSLFEERPLEDNDIAREARGRPFLPGREVDFNIAHSGSLAAVSYVTGKNLRTGCDVERARPRAKAREIAEEFFSAQERTYIFPQGGFDEARFYAIWTLKECFLKLRGLSVFDMAACPSFIGDEEKFAFCPDIYVEPSPLSFYLYELSGRGERYMLATAIEGAEQQPPELRWFSHLSLACKKTAEIIISPRF